MRMVTMAKLEMTEMMTVMEQVEEREEKKGKCGDAVLNFVVPSVKEPKIETNETSVLEAPLLILLSHCHENQSGSRSTVQCVEGNRNWAPCF